MKALSTDETLTTMENKVIALEVAFADANSRPTAPIYSPPGFGGPCTTCAPIAQPASPWGHPPNVVPGAAGGASGASSGSNDPIGALRAVIGGNQACHCVHVKELTERVGAPEAASRTVAATF